MGGGRVSFFFWLCVHRKENRLSCLGLHTHTHRGKPENRTAGEYSLCLNRKKSYCAEGAGAGGVGWAEKRGEGGSGASEKR